MKEYLLSLLNKFKNGTIKFKILICSMIILYIGILCVCLIQIDVDSTTPGTITKVSDVISIDSDNKSGKIYTVSVKTYSKMSLLQYWLVDADKYSEVSKGKSITLEIFTETEEHASNYGYKQQSIQDSLIVAYTEASKNGHEVVLDYGYKGQYLINIPQNSYKTGSEDFKNKDIVLGYNDILFTSEQDYLNALDNIFNQIVFEDTTIKEYKDRGLLDIYDANGKQIKENINLIGKIYKFIINEEFDVKFKVLRNKAEKDITPSLKMLFYLYTNTIFKKIDNQYNLYSITENYFTYYNINYDKCNPKINISKSDSVGPSGGLMQTLAVYNAITNDDITKGKVIVGTGGINLLGNVTGIGGEQQKVVTAYLYSADVFFIPSENYENAKKKLDTLDTNLKLVSVETFSDVITYLNNMEANNG